MRVPARELPSGELVGEIGTADQSPACHPSGPEERLAIVPAGAAAMRRLDDLVGIRHRLAALDLVDVLHACGHLAPDRVLAVEEGASSKQMKNWLLPEFGFAARAIEHGAAHMRFGVELGLELLAGAAGAGAVRAAGLRHEAVDDAVEDDAVIEALAHQFLDAGDVAGREVGRISIVTGPFEVSRINVFSARHVISFLLRTGWRGSRQHAAMISCLAVGSGEARSLESEATGRSASGRAVTGPRLVALLELVDDVHAGQHLADHRVLVVQEGAVAHT